MKSKASYNSSNSNNKPKAKSHNYILLLVFFVCLLAFTKIGNGNDQIRRMRSAFSSTDASRGVREMNQEAMRKYMKEAPWGIGMGLSGENVPPNNKYYLMSIVPPDSEYVNIWLRTGKIGLTVFLSCLGVILLGGCIIVFFKLKLYESFFGEIVFLDRINNASQPHRVNHNRCLISIILMEYPLQPKGIIFIIWSYLLTQ